MTYIKTLSISPSNFGSGSYPIQIAVNCVNTGRIWLWTIRPTSRWLMEHKFDAVMAGRRGLSLSVLEHAGSPAVSVSYDLANVCSESTIISDDHVRDTELLRVLFLEAGRTCPFEVEPADDFMRDLTTEEGDGGRGEIDRALALAAVKHPEADAESSARRLREAVAILVAMDGADSSELGKPA